MKAGTLVRPHKENFREQSLSEKSLGVVLEVKESMVIVYWFFAIAGSVNFLDGLKTHLSVTRRWRSKNLLEL